MTQFSGVEGRIQEKMPQLTTTEKRIGRALLANYPTLGLGPAVDLATAANASAATVLRFVLALGFNSYPDFQRSLRAELEERIKSPLQKTAVSNVSEGEEFLTRFADMAVENIRQTSASISAPEFESVCQQLANARGQCHVLGGRFSDALARYMVAHLRIVRPGVRQLASGPDSRLDQLLDIRAQDTVLIFDIRRYEEDLARSAAQIKARKAGIILITDQWISPVARYARWVFPAKIDSRQTWDASAAMFVLLEAMIARVTELLWRTAAPRIAEIERLHE